MGRILPAMLLKACGFNLARLDFGLNGPSGQAMNELIVPNRFALDVRNIYTFHFYKIPFQSNFYKL